MVTKISRLSGIFRTIFFLPNMLGGLALGFIWQFIFQIVFSQILFGPESLLPIPFLQNMTQDNTKALFALAILVTWQMAGYMMIIYITGLNNIPYDLYEAAEIDGASTFQRFRVITLPMLIPAFTVVFFLTLANCFKLLDQNALTDGAFGTRMLATQILRTIKDTTPPNYETSPGSGGYLFKVIAGDLDPGFCYEKAGGEDVNESKTGFQGDNSIRCIDHHSPLYPFSPGLPADQLL